MKALDLANAKPDVETGLMVADKYTADSGLTYQVGTRLFGDLKIVEGVAKGTANFFLVSVMVFNEKGSLVFDGEVARNTSYSREYVRRIVRDGLLSMLRDAAEKESKYYDELQAIRIIDAKLKQAYYELSYKAVINWANSLGIEMKSF